MVRKPEKAQYEVKQEDSDPEIDAKTTKEITEFLERFFNLYPTASKEELQYYIIRDSLPNISDTASLKFVKIMDPIFNKLTDSFQINVKVCYLELGSKTTQIFDYDLIIEKQNNWKIVEVE